MLWLIATAITADVTRVQSVCLYFCYTHAFC